MTREEAFQLAEEKEGKKTSSSCIVTTERGKGLRIHSLYVREGEGKGKSSNFTRKGEVKSQPRSKGKGGRKGLADPGYRPGGEWGTWTGPILRSRRVHSLPGGKKKEKGRDLRSSTLFLQRGVRGKKEKKRDGDPPLPLLAG